MATPPLLPSQLLAGLLQQWQLGLLVLLVSSCFLLASRRRASGAAAKDGPPRLPPGPAQVPVLGNLHLLGPLPHRSLRDLARRHGPVMLLRLGSVPTVVVSGAAAAREVMKEHDIDCCSRPASPGPRRLSYGLKDVAFAPYGEQWREARKLFIVELLSMRRVQAAWYAREQQVDRLIADLSRAGAEAAPVALNEHIFGLADGIVGTVAFGNIYGTERFAHRVRFQHVLDEAMDMMASFSAEDFFPNAAGRLVDRVTGLVARRERIFRELDAFFETVIDQHMDPARVVPENGGDLVDVLISLWKEHHRGTLRFTRDHVKGLIMDTFIGGIDTSSVTMLWAMSELIRKPRVLRKAQDEVRAVVGGKARVDPDDVPKLPYLKMVVKETLRLHPPATLLLPRETMRDVRIGWYDVPARTRVFVNAWAIGRDPASWADAEEFHPDRFEGSDVDYNGAHFELVPFGAGRRICPGLAMGETNVTFTLANLLYCFDWALPEGMAAEDVSMEEAGGLTFHQKMPLVLVPTRYHHRTATA
ncbi:hypothetical protein SEVIR_9G011700v4 [Setaria viridis]|uniref:4-hydroxyphenylacetaldehyde oxime monooxygenase n=1 Tax=Setaria viridis TaxID=4556 RepID=A0A4U6ST02_SETVI|nr:4-hydroxyphenylacetaldehyde oxime monooxygenase-like [Setaria viridis]TKV90182.1 hypothetical protein SEVIR_9G011700v2 [Setaria viridis]